MKVPAASRTIDRASMTLIALGAAIYIFAWVRMEELRTRVHTDFVPFQTELNERTREHARLSRTSRIGLFLAGTGVLVGVSAAIHAYISVRRKPDPESASAE
jgi:hypothetical protein